MKPHRCEATEKLSRVLHAHVIEVDPDGILTEPFTLNELRKVHEERGGVAWDKDSFRRRVLKLGVLEETGERKTEGGRPAMTYVKKSKGA